MIEGTCLNCSKNDHANCVEMMPNITKDDLFICTCKCQGDSLGMAHQQDPQPRPRR